MLDVQDFLCAVGYCMGDRAKIDRQKLVAALHQLYETDPRTYAPFKKHPYYETNDYVTETLISLAACSYLHMVWDGKSEYYEVSPTLAGATGKSYYDKLIAGQRKAARSIAVMLVGQDMLKSAAKITPPTIAVKTPKKSSKASAKKKVVVKKKGKK